MLKFISTGSAFNEELGNNSAFKIVSSTFILIDCGGTVFHKLLQANLLKNIKEIYVLITHTHPDHIGSLGDLIFYCYYMLNIKPTIIFPNRKPLADILLLTGVNSDFYELNSMSDTVTIQSSDEIIKLDYVVQKHIDTLVSYGYIINFNDTNIFYGGDSNEINEDILEKFNKGYIKYIYQDTCGKDFPGNPHLYIEKLAQYIMPELRHRVYCMHLDKAFDARMAEVLGFNVVKSEI